MKTSHNPSRRLWRLALLLAGPIVLIAGGLALDRFHAFPVLQFAVQRTAAAMPSTVAVPRADVSRGVPVLSVYVNPKYLFDPTVGLLPNRLQHGREWERSATMSYFEGGRLLFATGAGIRVHGDISRKISPLLSFRLYFRREYGEREFRKGLIFDASAEPIRHLVLHHDRFGENGKPLWHFINPLAYDIARRMGCLTVDTKPARFYLNGQFQGVYVLTEHISAAYLESHFGHSNFNSSNRSYDDLLGYLITRQPLTMAKVGAVVDLENMTRWFLSVLFCATEDAYQGAQLRDETRPGSKWFWINWDMDHSFLDYDGESTEPWEHDTFHHLLERFAERRRGRRPNEPRAQIFTALLTDDPDYREYFQKLFVEVMNYRVTPAFLAERFEYYRNIAETYGVQDRAYLPLLQTFLTRRPAVLRSLAEQYLNTPASVRCRLVSRATPVRIDGFDVPDAFEGYYFPGMSIELTAPSDDRGGFSHWLVGGVRVDGRTIHVRMDRDVVIEAVTGPVPGSTGTAKAEVQVVAGRG